MDDAAYEAGWLTGMRAAEAGGIQDQLRTWEVGPGLGELYRLYSRALNVSVAERCLAAFGTEQLSARVRAQRLITDAAASTWTTPPLAFAHHVGLARSPTPPVAAWALLELEVSLERDRPRGLITSVVNGSEPWVRYALRALGRDTADERPHTTLEVSVPTERERTSAADAIGLLDLAWSPMGDAVRLLVRQLVWFRTRDRAGIRSSSMPQVHGAVLVLAGARLVAMLHALVRETSRLDVTMRRLVDKLIVDDRERGATPFRPAERTCDDMLAGAVGDARVAYALARCAEYLRGRDREDALARADEARAQLTEAIDTLACAGRFTSAGEELMDTLARRVAPSSC